MVHLRTKYTSEYIRVHASLFPVTITRHVHCVSACFLFKHDCIHYWQQEIMHVVLMLRMYEANLSRTVTTTRHLFILDAQSHVSKKEGDVDTRSPSPRHDRLTIITYTLSLHTKFKVTPKVCHAVSCRPGAPTHLGVYSTPQPHSRKNLLGASALHVLYLTNADCVLADMRAMCTCRHMRAKD